MRSAMQILALGWAACSFAATIDTDGDGIPDAVEQQLGMDANRADKLTLILDDKAKGQGDTSHGRELRDAYDFTRVYFGNVARDRYVWRVDFTREPVRSQTIAFIIYVDADNDPNTGRDKGGPRGTDLMIRFETSQPFGPMRGARPRSVSAIVGSTAYFVVDAPMKQEAGQSVFRCYLLSQSRDPKRRGDSDTCPWATVRGPGNSDREPVAVAKGHPLYIPQCEFRSVGVRVFVQHDDTPRAHVTWITSWPTPSTIEYGTTRECARKAEAERAVRNHRIILRELTADTRYCYRVVGVGRAGKELRSDTLQFDTTPPRRKPCAVARVQIPLTVENPTDHALHSWPVTSGIPFPAGALTSPDRARLLGPDGKEVSCQVAVTARWLDRSIKWLLLDFQVSPEAKAKQVWTLEYGEEIERQPFDSPLCMTSWGGVTTVLTGPLKLQFASAEVGLLDRVWLDANDDGRFDEDERIVGAGEMALVAETGESYSSRATPADEVVVEDSGPLRVCVKIAGRHAASSGKQLFRYTLRVQAYAGQPFVRVFHTFANDATDQTFTNIKSLSLVTALNLRESTKCTVGAHERVECPATETRLFQSFDNHFLLTGTGKKREGRRAQGWIQLCDAARGATVAIRNFWQLYPKSLATDGRKIEVGICPALSPQEYDDQKVDEDKLYYYLLKGRYKLKCGVSKTHELLYCFHRAAQARDAEAQVAALNNPIIAVAPPKWYCDSMVFGEITPATEGEFAEYEAMVKRIATSFHRNRETNREYGMLNYGDYYGERRWNWGNIEYDTQHGFMLQFARTGNRDYYLLAEAAARHNVDVDHIHFHPKPELVGGVYTHCIAHVGDYYPPGYKRPAIATGHYGRGHAWNRGNLEYYLLSGYRRAGEVAMALSDLQAWRETINHRVRGAERATAWPLFAAVAAYRVTGDDYYLNAARLYVDAVAEQQTDAGHWNIPAGYSKVVPTPIGGYAWCTGLLLTALEDYYDETGDERAAKAAAKAGEWLLRTEWIPERQGFRATSCDSFNKSTPPGCECYRVPPGLGFVHDVTGERRFMDVALTGFAHAVRRGGGGKGGSVALCTTPHFIHDLKRLGITRLPASDRPAAISLPRALALRAGDASVIQGEVRGRAAEQPLLVRVLSLPKGWRASPMSQKVSEKHFEIRLDIPPDGWSSHEAVVRVAVTGGKLKLDRTITVTSVERVEHGKRIGLVAGADDFLGPALADVGVPFERISDVATDLAAYAAIWLGTQAHTLDAAKVASNAVAMHRYIKSGGLLVISQMNNDNWDPGYLPCRIELSEDNSVSGKILEPDHPIFRSPHRIEAAAGMEMFDTIAGCDSRAKILMADADGRPAIVEIPCGHGRVLLFEPSVERYCTGALTATSQAQQTQYAALFENIVAYVRRMRDGEQ